MFFHIKRKYSYRLFKANYKGLYLGINKCLVGVALRDGDTGFHKERGVQCHFVRALAYNVRVVEVDFKIDPSIVGL